MQPSQRHILVILDGYGIAEDPLVSAIAAADTPTLDHLFSRWPHAALSASGRDVGLPAGLMGNSEVGHTNLGAGRVVNQEITRINLAIERGAFFRNAVLCGAARHALSHGTALHLMGLLSDGGVHSHLDHLVAVCRLAAQEGLPPDRVCVHAFTDGRDTDPHGALRYAQAFEAQAGHLARIVSVVGRYYAMDRDQHWERTKKALALLTTGEGEAALSATSALRQSYNRGITDEFVAPWRIEPNGLPTRYVLADDAVIWFNFRADRARQLVQALTMDGPVSALRPPRLHLATLTPYDRTFAAPVAFQKVDLTETLGEVISNLGMRQLRVAETEKYPHVTYFFSGGREAPFPGEDRLLVPSPRVPRYDMQPTMSAAAVARRCAKALAQEHYHFVCLNFANLDMVGHTGVFKATVKAVEAADRGVQTVVQAARAYGYSVTILADHGNADKMRNPDGSPHTAHTTALVPHLVMHDEFRGPLADGRLADVAPTILKLLGIPVPETMTGRALV